MISTSGRIFSADQRGLTETSVLKRFSTFNFEKFNSEHTLPFGDLFICNDDFIVGGKLAFFLSKEDSYQLFFPITGGLNIVQGNKECAVDTGQMQVLNLGKGEVLEISNRNLTETTNYLQIGIRTDIFLLRASEMLFNFDFDTNPNKLIEIISHPKLPFKVSAGHFAENMPAFYRIQRVDGRFFCFVIAGTLKIEGRLMHERDALALWDLEEVQLEALSNNASVLILEF